jgi:hypothetical protein
MGRGRWCSGCLPQPVGEVDLIRCSSGKSLMGALLVKEAKVGLQSRSQIRKAVVGVQVDMLVLYRAPEALDKDVVHPSSFAIHADLDAVCLQDAGEVLAGKLGSLIGVEDLRPSVLCNGLFKRLGAKVRGHGLRQPPRQHSARGLVHHGHQVGKALGHRDVRDIRTPDFIGSCNGRVAKQVGVDPVRQVRDRRSGLLVHRRDAHLAHQALDAAPGDGNALPMELILDAARPHVGMLQMQLVDSLHQVEPLRRGRRGQSVDPGSGQAQKSLHWATTLKGPLRSIIAWRSAIPPC